MTKNLELKRQPTQERSRQRLNNIIESTNTLLTRDGLKGLTMPKLAKEANISVGSLYQYFPNKLAVLKALYEEYLSTLRSVINNFADALTEETDWRTGFEEMFDEVFNAEERNGPIPELIQAMAIYPELDNIDREHSIKVGHGILRVCKHYQFPGTDAELMDLIQFIYALNIGTWSFREHNNTASQLRKCREWELVAAVSVIDKYLKTHGHQP